MKTLLKIVTIIAISFMLLWLYIANCLYWDDYKWVYSENYFASSGQRILEGLWTIFTFFGWFIWLIVNGVMFIAAFPKLKDQNPYR